MGFSGGDGTTDEHSAGWHPQPKPVETHVPQPALAFCALLQDWTFVPRHTVGYGKAEVTRGGVDTDELYSKTMEAKNPPGYTSSARSSTSPGGLADTTSNGRGRRDLRPVTRFKKRRGKRLPHRLPLFPRRIQGVYGPRNSIS